MVGKFVCQTNVARSRRRQLLRVVTLIVVTTTIGTVWSTAQAKPAKPMPGDPAPEAPKSLKSVKVPLPKDLDKYIKDKKSAILLGKADAALAASIFHFGEYTIGETKRIMQERGVAVRQIA